MDKNFIIIGTTAINRPDLHNIVLPKWKKWLLNSEKQIIWFINIDILEYLNESYENTKKNMEILLNDSRIELIILEQQYDKFLGACKNLSINIKNYVENKNLDKNMLKVVWLEDDWDINSEIDCIDCSFNDIEKYCKNMTHINLSGIKNNYIWALAPSILTYHFWLNIFYEAWINQNIDLCPEKSIGNYYQSIYYNSEKTPNIILLREKIDNNIIKSMCYENTHILMLNESITDDKLCMLSDDPLFIKLYPNITFDIGIEYMKNKNIVKQFVKKNRRQIVIEYKWGNPVSP